MADRRGAAVRLAHCRDDRKTQPRAGARSALLAAAEAFESPPFESLGEAAALVADLEDDQILLGSSRDGDRAGAVP
jgi:hypothetical protein